MPASQFALMEGTQKKAAARDKKGTAYDFKELLWMAAVFHNIRYRIGEDTWIFPPRRNAFGTFARSRIAVFFATGTSSPSATCLTSPFVVSPPDTSTMASRHVECWVGLYEHGLFGSCRSLRLFEQSCLIISDFEEIDKIPGQAPLPGFVPCDQDCPYGVSTRTKSTSSRRR